MWEIDTNKLKVIDMNLNPGTCLTAVKQESMFQLVSVSVDCTMSLHGELVDRAEICQQTQTKR